MQVADLPGVSIVVVNYNSTELLRKCLQSIATFTQGVPTQTIVVDNASTDEDPRRLAAAYPRITLVANRENVGYARANNHGMTAARGEYILLLNPDAELLEGSLEVMVRYMETHPDVGVVGPRLLNADGTLQPSSYRFPRLTEVAVSLFALRKVFPVVRLRGSLVGTILARRFRHFSENLREEDVDWVTGACMLLRRSAVDVVGMLDEVYFMYFEEIDWCRRFKRNGWRVVYLPTANVLHLIGQSSLGKIGRRFFHRQVSASFYFAKHHGRGALVFLSLLVSMGAAMQFLAGTVGLLLKRTSDREDVRYYWRTMKHFARLLAHGGATKWLLDGMSRAAE